MHKAQIGLNNFFMSKKKVKADADKNEEIEPSKVEMNFHQSKLPKAETPNRTIKLGKKWSKEQISLPPIK